MTPPAMPPNPLKKTPVPPQMGLAAGMGGASPYPSATAPTGAIAAPPAPGAADARPAGTQTSLPPVTPSAPAPTAAPNGAIVQPAATTAGPRPAPTPAVAGGTPNPVPPQNPTDPTAALGQVQAAFHARFGRAMTPQEQQALQNHLGYAGGDVSPDMLQRALAAVGQYSGDLANPGIGGGGTTPTTGGEVTGPELEAEQRRQLMALLRGETPVTVDPNNPAAAAERNYFARANSQATTRQRLAASERAAARGETSTGGFDAGMAGIENDAATRSSGFESELMQNERQGQIDRLMSALGMAQQHGATNLQGQLGRGQLSLGYLNAMLNDRHANNSLGFNYTQLQQQANERALAQLLNGMA